MRGVISVWLLKGGNTGNWGGVRKENKQKDFLQRKLLLFRDGVPENGGNVYWRGDQEEGF